MIEQKIETPEFEFDWDAIAAALFVAKGVSSGLWRIGVKMNFAALNANWQEFEASFPTSMVAVSGLALFKAEATGPMVFDAAVIRKKASVKVPGAKKRLSKDAPN